MRIILGVTGSIAAYKSALLTRLLIKAGHEVKVVMTTDAAQFISPLTLSTLSKHPVILDFYEDNQWANHVELGLWADLFLIAPATANTLAKMSNGLCDNMLLATYLSAKCPIWYAPAMDLDMWRHPATRKNLDTLSSFDHHTLIPVGTGALASGLEGPGRMAEPEEIVAQINKAFDSELELSGKHILITAGPTREALDPVRYISNRSTGTMGKALANNFLSRGAEVTLVAGPISLEGLDSKVDVIPVESAQEMYLAAQKNHTGKDVVVFAAAVADFSPQSVAEQKVKKGKSSWDLTLHKTVDIAATLGSEKSKNQIHIGFALESDVGVTAAKGKLAKKNFDFIVLNSLQEAGAGFGTTTNKISIFDDQGRKCTFGTKPKTEVAQDIVDYYIKHYNS